VFAVGVLAYFLVKLAPPTPYLSDLIIAIGLGALITNTPVARLIGLGDTAGRDQDRYERGLRYTGKFVLRLAIILMGLKIQTDLFQADQALIIFSVLLFALPTAFFATHAASQLLGLRREMGDLLAMGTMVCGASAINALAPAIQARRRDQGLAITAVFIFTLFALLTFYPAANALGLPADLSGLWAGLAVNDLAGSVAVGVQFGDDPALVATASKSVRIVLLGPLIIGFSILRRTGRTKPERPGLGRLAAYLPLFILGYFVCFGLRVAGDAAFGAAPGWAGFLDGVDGIIKFAILAVCAGIGLHLQIRVIIDIGWKAIVAGGAASIAMAGLSLFMLVAIANDAWPLALLGGALATGGAWAVYRVQRGTHPERSALGRRFRAGTPLSIREAVELLEGHDIRETLTPAIAEQIIVQLSPAIGELQPLREGAVQPPLRYRRVVYWESSRGAGSLLGVLWPPGTETQLHSHNFVGVGKTIEGRVQSVDFESDGEGTLRYVGTSSHAPGDLLHFDAPDAVHAVRNPGARDSLDIFFYGPTSDAPAQHFEVAEEVRLVDLTEGDRIQVEAHDHSFPIERLPHAFFSRRNRRKV